MSEQMQLPYLEIEKSKIANRTFLRENFERGSNEIYKIPFADIKIRENFNRKEFKDIEELSLLIEEHGLLTPLTVDVLIDHTIYLEQGERRYRAIKMLRDKGNKSFKTVECFVNNNQVTEYDRTVNIWISNSSRQDLHVLDQAENIVRIKTLYGKKLSNEEIGQKLGVSRQTVDNLILLNEQPDDFKNELRIGNYNYTTAMAAIRNKNKIEKQADKAEEDSHKTSDAPTPLPKDELAGDIKELEALNIRAEQQEQREKEFEEKEFLRLEKEAVLVEVSYETLTIHIGKRLAMNATSKWSEDFADPDSGEVVSIERFMIAMKQGVLINEQTIEDLIEAKVKEVWIFKEVTIAPSVITQIVEGEEKSKFDLSRIEISQIQNIISLSDKLEMMVSKLDVPDGLKKDVIDVVKWIQKDADELRTWIHSNKKQNKIR